MLLFLSPLHIPSTLSFVPSSSLVSHVASKLCATQAQQLERARNEVREVGGGGGEGGRGGRNR
jgi:hypothetical protein